MLGGAVGGVAGLPHPANVIASIAAASAIAVAEGRARRPAPLVGAILSGGGVVRGNFAADQFDLLRPRIGFRYWPQYKLVETLRNILAEARDHVVGRAVNGPLEVGLRATAHRGEHRPHLLGRALARRRDAAEQNQSRLDVRVGASVAGGIVVNLRHARAEFFGRLERRKEAVGQARRAFQRRVGTAADPDIHRAEVMLVRAAGRGSIVTLSKLKKRP